MTWFLLNGILRSSREVQGYGPGLAITITRWRGAFKRVTRCLIVVFFVLLAGCQTQQVIVNGTFTSPQKTYKVVLPGEGWVLLGQRMGEDLAMWNSDGEGWATFAIISRREEHGNLPLDILQTHLFIGIRHRKILSKQYVTLSTQRALHTILIGEVNGGEIKISSYVITRNGWVCDIVYWAQPEHFDGALDDFERMVKSFVFINGR